MLSLGPYVISSVQFLNWKTPLDMIRRRFLALAPEWIVVASLLAVTLALRMTLRTPLEWSSVGPLLSNIFKVAELYVAVAVWLWLVLRAGLRLESPSVLLRSLAQHAGDGICFGTAVFLCLYLKLFVPLIRVKTYDRLYEVIDRRFFSWMDPLIAWRARALQFNWIDGLYLFVFFGMFCVSFIIHSLRGRAEFRRVFLASLLVQATGGVLYLVAPALRPFLFHPSANALTVETQRSFCLVRQKELAAGGALWFSAHAGQFILCGLGAMPSLHAAASFVFLRYAWRHVRQLAFVYVPIFSWILFEAMATRWHYGIDLIVGIALAGGCIALANRWVEAHERVCKQRPEQNPAVQEAEAV